MNPENISKSLRALQEAWENLPTERRIAAESTQGIDLYPQYEHLISGIDAILISPNAAKRISGVPLALWISYLACISVRRFIFTAWILNESIPGFIDKLIDTCTTSEQEYPKYVYKRLEMLTRRTLISEMLRPELFKKAAMSRISESKT